MISKEDLIVGQIYAVKARGFYVAVWTGEVFKGPTKFEGEYRFVTEAHFYDGLPYGTVIPERTIGDMFVSRSFDGGNFLAAMVALNEEVWKHSVTDKPGELDGPD